MKKLSLLCAVLFLFTLACGDDPVLPPPNLVLASLTVSSGTLTPAFDPAITTYTVNVSNTVDQITVAGTAADTNNTVSYEPAQPASLTVGSNLITVQVASADGSATDSYRVVVYRFSSDADLASLEITTGTLVPAFDLATTNYTIATYVSNDAVLNAVTAHPGASFDCTPAFTTGSNTYTIRVSAEDATTTRDYTIRVYRMGADYTSATIGTLIYVPAGAFQRDETATNISFVSALRMSRTEITRSQYSNVMGADPANTTYSSGTSDPVQTVTWYHAIAFCNKLSIAEGLEPVYSVSGVNFNNLTHTGVPTTNNATWNAATANWSATGYRLPTEMEWMWAAMGANMGADPFAVNTTGYSKAFAGSTGSNAIGDYAWYGYYSGGSATEKRTTVAGSKLPNKLGLADMSGNVWAWCWDWYESDYPAGYQTDYRGAASGTKRVVRGGSWSAAASLCTVAYRNSPYPYYQNYDVGFRVVRP